MDVRVTEGTFSKRLLQEDHLDHVGDDRDDHLALRIGRPACLRGLRLVALCLGFCFEGRSGR